MWLHGYQDITTLTAEALLYHFTFSVSLKPSLVSVYVHTVITEKRCDKAESDTVWEEKVWQSRESWSQCWTGNKEVLTGDIIVQFCFFSFSPVAGSAALGSPCGLCSFPDNIISHLIWWIFCQNKINLEQYTVKNVTCCTIRGHGRVLTFSKQVACDFLQCQLWFMILLHSTLELYLAIALVMNVFHEASGDHAELTWRIVKSKMDLLYCYWILWHLETYLDSELFMADMNYSFSTLLVFLFCEELGTEATMTAWLSAGTGDSFIRNILETMNTVQPSANLVEHHYINCGLSFFFFFFSVWFKN